MRKVRITIYDEKSDMRVEASMDYDAIKELQKVRNVDVIRDVLFQLNEKMNNKLGEHISIFEL